MKQYRIGIVGAGNIAQSAHLPAYKTRDDAVVVAIADTNLARAEECAARFGIPHAYSSVEELLAHEDVDVIDICVWNRYHAPVAIAAAKAGKAILCEKPMAWNLDDAIAMKEEIDRTGVPFMMAMVKRYQNEVQLLRRMEKEGKLGEIYYGKCAYIRRRGTPIGWFTDVSKAGGGPVIDIGVHCIDDAWYLMGRPRPVRISAQTAYRIGNFKTEGVERWTALDSDVTAFDTEDSACGVIHFENGAALLFEVSWALNTPEEHYVEICGTKAGAKLEPLRIFGEEENHLVDITPTVLPNNGFEAEIGHFLRCLTTGEKPESPIEDGVTVMRMLMGIYESARTGREVEI